MGQPGKKPREKNKHKRETKNKKNNDKIGKMNNDELIVALKSKGLPLFGSRGEKQERLRKFAKANVKEEKRDGVLFNIQKIKKKRAERRKDMNKRRQDKMNRQLQNRAQGIMGDVDFEKMLEKHKFKKHMLQEHVTSEKVRICVCVRKRPIFKKELMEGELDCVSVANPQIKILENKLKVDGITKYIDQQRFVFDNTFNENYSNDEIYDILLRPILGSLFAGGRITLFAYG